MHIIKAESALATLAVEVHMHIFYGTVVLTGAKLVLKRAAPVFDGMHDVMLMKQGKYSENRRFVGSIELFTEVGQRNRRIKPLQWPSTKETSSSGTSRRMAVGFNPLIDSRCSASIFRNFSVTFVL